MLYATEFRILRGVPTARGTSIALERKPLRMATLLDLDAFTASGASLQHGVTVYFEDEMHDWAWRDGRLRYFPRVHGEALDAVAVYAEEDRKPVSVVLNFCPECGQPVSEEHRRQGCCAQGHKLPAL